MVLCLVLSVCACQADKPKVLPLPQHSHIQVYLNHNQAASYTDPYRGISRSGDNLEQILIDQINQATSTLDVAVQELRLPKIAEAMMKRQQAGVKVRLILENNYSRPWSEYTPQARAKFNNRETDKYSDFVKFADLDGNGQLSESELDQRDAVRMIKKAKIAWIDDKADGSKGSGLMHHKFVIVDNKIVLLGSANFTLSDMHGDFATSGTLGNQNNLVRIDSAAIATLFTQEFNLMWGDGPAGKQNSLFGHKKPTRAVETVMVGDAQVQVKFSPNRQKVPWEQTSNGVIGATLAASQKSVDIALFVFSEPKLANILEIRHQNNVQLRTLVDPGFAYRAYSSALDMWGFVSPQDCKHGNSRPWTNPADKVGVPDLPTGDLLHHKFGVIDQNTVITGSHNWSTTANYNNDENLVIIKHPMVATHFQREFDRLFQNATLGPTANLSQSAPTSCQTLEQKMPNKRTKHKKR